MKRQAHSKPSLRQQKGRSRLSATTQRFARHGRGETFRPGNIVVIDSLRSNPEQLYASAAGKDKDILRDEKALDSISRRMRAMNLSVSESDKGWMGEFNKTLRSRIMDRTRDRGVAEW